MKMTLRMKMRASHVKRWHIVETSRPQTVAEHSFNVAIICEEIANLVGIDHSDIIYYALHHDLPEVVFGDIPTPVKTIFPQVNGSLDELSNELDDLSAFDGSTVKSIAKIADLLDAILFLAQYGVGTHAQKVRRGLIELCSDKIVELNIGVVAKSKVRTLFNEMCTWETKNDVGEGVSWHSLG